MPALGRNIATVLVGRLFAGFFGVSPVGVMGGIVSDCFTMAHRGIAMALTVCLVFSGPTFGPVIGGAIVGSPLDWRWTLWVVITSGLGACALAVFTYPESYQPTILRKEASVLRKKHGNPNVKSALDKEKFTLKDVARVYLMRPFCES